MILIFNTGECLSSKYLIGSIFIPKQLILRLIIAKQVSNAILKVWIRLEKSL